jgi:hypothetical protein
MRAALTSVFQVCYPDMPKIANHEYFQSFFKAKRSMTVPIPKPDKLETWDLDIVMHHLQHHYTNNDELPTYELQKKAIVLTCIATIWRPRSDVGRIQERDITFAKDDADQVTGVTLVVRQPKEAQSKYSRYGVMKDSPLCPVKTLFDYIQRTKELRAELPEDHTIWLASLKQENLITAALPATVAGYVREVMAEAGLNTHLHTPHTLRSATSTKAIQKGSTVLDVKLHANWSLNSQTFERYYLKPTHQESRGARLLNVIFPGPTENYTT